MSWPEEGRRSFPVWISKSDKTRAGGYLYCYVDFIMETSSSGKNKMGSGIARVGVLGSFLCLLPMQEILHLADFIKYAGLN